MNPEKSDHAEDDEFFDAEEGDDQNSSAAAERRKSRMTAQMEGKDLSPGANEAQQPGAGRAPSLSGVQEQRVLQPAQPGGGGMGTTELGQGAGVEAPPQTAGAAFIGAGAAVQRSRPLSLPVGSRLSAADLRASLSSGNSHTASTRPNSISRENSWSHLSPAGRERKGFGSQGGPDSAFPPPSLPPRRSRPDLMLDARPLPPVPVTDSASIKSTPSTTPAGDSAGQPAWGDDPVGGLASMLGAEPSKFMVVNKDTGETFDLRELEKHLPSEQYTTLLPSREALMEQRNRRSLERGKSQEEDDRSPSNRQNKGAAVLSKMKAGFGKVGKMGALGNADKPREVNPNSIKLSVSRKDSSDFSGLMLFQEIRLHSGPVWTMAFSHGGNFLASAGQDGRVYVFRVAGSGPSPAAPPPPVPGMDSVNAGRPDRPAGSGDAAQGTPRTAAQPSPRGSAIPSLAADRGFWHRDAGDSEHRRSVSEPPAPGVGGGGGGAAGRRNGGSKALGLVDDTPAMVLDGHTADVIDLCWSKNDFLLSASLDKTVRLWHTSQPQCLHTFQHADIVTAVDFHPTFEHFFLSGCFDKKIRIWNIRDGRVQEWQQAPDMVTAARFSSDGLMLLAGLFRGQVLFYQTEGMRYFTQIECRNRRGALKGGRKVTGLAFRKSTSREQPRGGKASKSGVSEEVLVTTNDSRLRMYQIDGFVMEAKYKGLTNDTLQIKANFSEDGQYIICGSENGKAYIWTTSGQPVGRAGSGVPPSSGAQKETNRCYEAFTATTGDPAIVTSACFVPELAVKSCVAAIKDRLSPELDAAGKYRNSMILTADYEGVMRVYSASDVLLK